MSALPCVVVLVISIVIVSYGYLQSRAAALAQPRRVHSFTTLNPFADLPAPSRMRLSPGDGDGEG